MSSCHSWVDENDPTTNDKAALRFPAAKLLNGIRSVCQPPVRPVTRKDVFELVVAEQLEAEFNSVVKAAPDTGALMSSWTCVYKSVCNAWQGNVS